MQRREFLGLGMMLPLFAYAKAFKKQEGKTLILIELQGGNDGLNMVIPYKNTSYYKARPTLSIPSHKVLKLNGEIGFHPAMEGLKEIFEHKEMCIVQGVGYPHPNLSHFRSIDIWNSASKSNEFKDKGWLVDLLEKNSINSEIKALILGGSSGPVYGLSSGSVKVQNLKQFVRRSNFYNRAEIFLTNQNEALKHLYKTRYEIIQSAKVLSKYLRKDPSLQGFDKTGFGNQMKLATQLLADGAEIPVMKLSLGSFDTHQNQAVKHAKLLSEFSKNITAMRTNLIEHKVWKNVVIMTYSEFGRRVAENANRGTDHGTAAAHFIITGDAIKQSIVGQYPSLIDLDKAGNMKYTVDFHTYYNMGLKYLRWQ